MTDTSGPWQSAPWGETEWFKYLSAALPSGVIGSPQASAAAGPLGFTSSGLTPTLAIGRAMVGGAWFDRDAATALSAITPNGTGNPRIDRIVLRRDLGAHTVTPVRIAGTPAASPVAPAITRTDTVFDLKLFQFRVPASNGTTLTNIVDERAWISDGISANPNDVTVDGDLDVVGDTTLAGTLSVTGAASGNTPTSSGHFATKGYVDGRMQSGRTSTISFTNDSFKTGTVSFSPAFSSAPRVSLTAEVTSGSNVDLLPEILGAVTTTGFTWRMRDRGGATVTVDANLHWIAIR